MQGGKCSWVGTAWEIPNTACDDGQSDLLSSAALDRGHIAPALCIPIVRKSVPPLWSAAQQTGRHPSMSTLHVVHSFMVLWQGTA